MNMYNVTWVSDYFTVSNTVSADDSDGALDASRESLFEAGMPESVLALCWDVTAEYDGEA